MRELLSRAWKRFFDWVLSCLPDWADNRIKFWADSFGLIASLLMVALLIARRLTPESWNLPTLPSWEWIALAIILMLLFAEGAYRQYAPLKQSTDNKAKYSGLLPFHSHGQMLIAYSQGWRTYSGTDTELQADCLQWVQNTRTYIALHFNQSRAALWDSIISEDQILVSVNLSTERRTVLGLAYPRVKKLEDIMKEVWAAAGFKDTELGVWMEPEVDHGATEVYAGVQAGSGATDHRTWGDGGASRA